MVHISSGQPNCGAQQLTLTPKPIQIAGYFGLVSSPQAISRTQRRLFLTYNSMAVSDAFKYFFREGVMNVGAAGEKNRTEGGGTHGGEVGARLDGKEL